MSHTARRWADFLRRARNGGCADDHQRNSSKRGSGRQRHPRHQAAGGNSERLGMALVGAGRCWPSLVAAFLLWRWWQKRSANVPVVPPVPAHVRAKQKLEEALALISQPKPFVIAVSDTARTYLEERFQFPRAGTDDGGISARIGRDGIAAAGPKGKPRRIFWQAATS